ncbi:MAG: alpha/beta fold hydrolase [Phycisphaerae bacterium]
MPLPKARQPDDGTTIRRQVLELADGHRSDTYHYIPSGRRSGPPVVYLHGIQSHPGWFTGSCEHLARQGREVFAVTRRGSGADSEHRGDAPSVDLLLDDVDRAVGFAADSTGCERVHLLGVSWGGKLAAAYACEKDRSSRLASLVLVAPGIVPQVDVSVGVKLRVALSLLLSPERLFEIPLSDVELFTDNEPMKQFIRNDHLSLRRATARFLYVSRKLDRYLRTRPRGAICCETTLILADRDRIVDNHRTREVVGRLTAGRDVVVELGGAHTLEFEPDPTPFYEALESALAHA